MKYDAIIVGSGIAGMTSAAILALEGKRVLLLERHNVFGGLLQVYRRDRLTFPTGVHSLGSLSEGQPLWKYFNYLGVLDRLNFVEMDPAGFQQFIFPGKTFTMPTGHAAYRERLIEYFPEERPAINQFMNDMTECMKHSPFYQVDSSLNFIRTAQHNQSLREYLNQITNSEPLRCCLAAAYPLYGVEPSECPVFTHFAVLDSYLSSAYRVDERSNSMSKAFLFRLKELGVEMRRSADVEEVVCEGRTVKGVRLSDGEILKADTVIYTGHPKELAKRCASLRNAFKWRIGELEDTVGFMNVCMAWERPECPVSRSDAFVYNTWNIDEALTPWNCESNSSPGALYLAALPRPERERYSVVAIVVADFNDWKPWADLDTGGRGQEYEDKKSKFSELILAAVRAQWPEAASGIHNVNTNTPLTLRDYTLSPQGTGYGVKRTVSTLMKSQVGSQTSVRGLYMAGQSCQMPGILGTLISSVTACSKILGQDYLLNKISASTSRTAAG